METQSAVNAQSIQDTIKRDETNNSFVLNDLLKIARQMICATKSSALRSSTAYTSRELLFSFLKQLGMSASNGQHKGETK